ncbi:MAG: GTP-binding protein [Anaerofustis sp.]
MNMIIMGGFLGSGKTSIVLQMAKYLIGDGDAPKATVAILENEIGEISVDDQILKSDGYKVETMFSGCVCCTMSGELIVNVSNIMREMNPDWIIMEATGIAYPHNIKENLQYSLKIDSRIICVADAQRWQRLLRPMGMLIGDQLKEADVILVNKIDLVDNRTLDEVDHSLAGFNPSAKRFPICASEKIPIELWQYILKTPTEVPA